MLAEMGVAYKEVDLKLAPELLQKFVGKYEIQPGLMVTITLEGGNLYGEPTGQEKLELTPMAEDRFYLDERNIQVHFQA